MSMKLLKVDQLAIHLIQRSTRSNPAQPTLSEALTELTDQNRGFLQDRLRETLKKARPIIDDSDTSSPVPKLIRGLLEDGDDLLTVSRRLAEELQSKQAGISPSGLLLVAEVTLGSDSGVVLAKWEHERGARTEQVTNTDGKLVYDMQFLEDLFMTEASRVYKVALFLRSEVTTDHVEGRVIDPQSSGMSVAHYFRVNFLGCDYKVRPELQTEQFHGGARDFIGSLLSPEKRARYQVALMSEMLSNKDDLSVTGFSREHLDADDRDAFNRFMASRSVPLRSTIPKDLTLVRTQLKRMQVDFEHGTILLTPPDEMGPNGHVEFAEDNGVAYVTITDKVASVSGRGSIKLDDDGQADQT